MVDDGQYLVEGPFCQNCGQCCDCDLCDQCSRAESAKILTSVLKDIEHFSDEDCLRTGKLLKNLSKYEELSLSYIKNRYGALPLNMKWIHLKIVPGQPTMVSITTEGKNFVETMKRLKWPEL